MPSYANYRFENIERYLSRFDAGRNSRSLLLAIIIGMATVTPALFGY